MNARPLFLVPLLKGEAHGSVRGWRCTSALEVGNVHAMMRLWIGLSRKGNV